MWTGQSSQLNHLFAAGIRKIIDGKAPFFFHCQEGIDRTGIFAALLEGICGAGWQEMVDDNMLTYRNYYDIVPGSKAYDQISQHLFRMFRMLSEDTFDKANVYASTLSIFHKLGITDEEIHALIDKLSQNQGRSVASVQLTENVGSPYVGDDSALANYDFLVSLRPLFE